jgi:hypothetical protein
MASWHIGTSNDGAKNIRGRILRCPGRQAQYQADPEDFDRRACTQAGAMQCAAYLQFRERVPAANRGHDPAARFYINRIQNNTISPRKAQRNRSQCKITRRIACFLRFRGPRRDVAAGVR